MIHTKDITVVLQGDIRSGTAQAIRSVRSVLPDAHLILSTFDTEAIDTFVNEVDEVILSCDPGAMPPYTMAINAAPNNTNRQLVSTQAGLERVSTPYALKMRTDCILYGLGFVDLLEQISAADQNTDRLVVSSFFTRHPRGLSCYLFHVSDWFVFGGSNRVRQFFSAPLMSFDEATWFERHAHLKTGTYAASRFRARFTPEQYITTHFARVLGYSVPSFLNDLNPELTQEYETFLAKEVLVANPGMLGFSIGKYPDVGESLYQKIDCVSFCDWLDILFNCTGKKTIDSYSFCVNKKFPMAIIRYLANKFRHSVIRVVLGLKKSKKNVIRKHSFKPTLACVITGVPRGNSFCLESLRFTTKNFDTTYFAVFREEFDNKTIREEMNSLLPGIRFVIVPSVASRNAVSRFEGKDGPADTVIKMWHEISYAADQIDFGEFAFVLRTRFDIFFAPMFLQPPSFDSEYIFIPDRMSWSGSNDMIAFGVPQAFIKYARIFECIEWLISDGIKIPEMIVACAIPHLKLKEGRLEIFFGLYRGVLMSGFNLNQLGVLAWKFPNCTEFKIGNEADTSEARDIWSKDIESLIQYEALFPTYQVTFDYNFYPVEVDVRDGTPFRFMGLHAHFHRAFSVARYIEFTICHYPPGWSIEDLKVAVDGRLFELKIIGLDEFNRIRVFGELEQPYIGKSPWSKVGLSCLRGFVHTEEDKNSSDSRLLSISITEPRII